MESNSHHYDVVVDPADIFYEFKNVDAEQLDYLRIFTEFLRAQRLLAPLLNQLNIERPVDITLSELIGLDGVLIPSAMVKHTANNTYKLAVTTGLMKLDDAIVQGVFAHELAHVHFRRNNQDNPNEIKNPKLRKCAMWYGERFLRK